MIVVVKNISVLQLFTSRMPKMIAMIGQMAIARALNMKEVKNFVC